jgi:hypothetical protein
LKTFLDQHGNGRRKTFQPYTTTLNQLLENLPQSVRFVDDFATILALSRRSR